MVGKNAGYHSYFLSIYIVIWCCWHFFLILRRYIFFYSSLFLFVCWLFFGVSDDSTYNEYVWKRCEKWDAVVCFAQPNLLCHPIRSELAYVIARNEVSYIFHMSFACSSLSLFPTLYWVSDLESKSRNGIWCVACLEYFVYGNSFQLLAFTRIDPFL